MIVLVVFVAFLPALGAEFLRWDDSANFISNANYRGLGPAQLKWMWSTTLLGHYVPISWMTLGLDYTLWGMDARGYHLTNLLLHCAAAVLLYFVAMRLFSDRPAAELRIPVTLAVLVFAVHPLRVESVAWVTERRDVLSLAFMLGSALLYLRWLDSHRRSAYIASLLVFALALLSKASVVTLPLVLLLVPGAAREKVNASPPYTLRRAIPLLPFFALSTATALVSITVLKKPEQLPFLDKLAVSAYGIGFYLMKTVLPVGLSPLYAMPRPLDPFAPNFLVAYAIAAAAVVIAWASRKRAPAVTALLLASAIIVFPLLGVVQNGPQLAADRYTYHASAALSLLVAVILLRWPARLVHAATAAVVVVLAVLTARQTGYWVNSDRLWERVLAVDSTSAVAQIAMGDLRVYEKRDAEALLHYQRGVALAPDYAEGHNNLGVLLAGRGEYAKAIPHYLRALALRPAYAEAHVNYGVSLAQLGRFDEAVAEFTEAVRLDPELKAAPAYLAAAKEAQRVQRTLRRP